MVCGLTWGGCLTYLNKTTFIGLLLLATTIAWAKAPSEPTHVEQLFNPVLVEDIKRSVVETLNSPYEYTRNRKNIFENSLDKRRAPASAKDHIEVSVPSLKAAHEKSEW